MLRPVAAIAGAQNFVPLPAPMFWGRWRERWWLSGAEAKREPEGGMGLGKGRFFRAGKHSLVDSYYTLQKSAYFTNSTYLYFSRKR